ncbi:hypothetical protein HMPREF1057_00023 [Bacteroides finegoldii CL09T03C10]|uniref:Uncharacterized protein n=1 Tax=Bacteroides finegoldii CL09T03C10 TaxID=997888 RepID=K5CTI5_9BACE|nr:hypothetical protein HMPREF1057_00023 [Bacteroides finegoldii CL09T03C10]
MHSLPGFIIFFHEVSFFSSDKYKNFQRTTSLRLFIFFYCKKLKY